MKIALSLLALILAALLVGWVASMSTETTEINAMTGATRTKVRRALVFETPWTEKSTWVAESAKRQGISTTNGWQSLGILSRNFVYRSRGSAPPPAAYPLHALKPEFFGLKSEAEIDRFTRDFVAAPEAARNDMLLRSAP